MTCPTKKVRHSSPRAAKASAHIFARALNYSGEFSEDMYAYRCDKCHGWHITRRSEWEGEANTQVFVAPPRELQEWAMERPE